MVWLSAGAAEYDPDAGLSGDNGSVCLYGHWQDQCISGMCPAGAAVSRPVSAGICAHGVKGTYRNVQGDDRESLWSGAAVGA